MENTREIILDTLLLLEKGEELSHKLLRDVLDKYDYLDPRDKGFIKRVTEGTIERKLELDYYLNQYSSVPVSKMKPLIRCLLRMSLYQILFMDGTPDSAVCNEACKLASKRKFQNLKGFVNGVLRKIAREKGQLTLPDPQKEELEYLCIRYSMPEWITKMWLSEYGRELTETMLKGLLEIHPVSLRVTAKVSESEEESMQKRLEEAGIRWEKNPYLPRMYFVTDLDGLGNLEDFQNGNLLVQDTSSVLAVKMAGIESGELVIDVCGAPGGKTIYASEMVGDAGKVVVGDVSEYKTEKIEENLERVGCKNVEVRVWDGRIPCPEFFGKADVVLLDVPCSGLGVIGKKRDIKYRVNEAGLKELEKLQKEIVDNAWQYVKPGGVLLYSTCTVRWQENRDMVSWILQNLPFEPVSIEEELPQEIQKAVQLERKARAGKNLQKEEEACMAQLLPGILSADGFFFAKLRRKAEND